MTSFKIHIHLSCLKRAFAMLPVIGKSARWCCAACLVLFAAGMTRADVFSNVPEAADYSVAYELAIPLNGAFQGATAVPYSVNQSATVAPGGFDRVAYYLELTSATGTTWGYASMDAFTSVVTQTGLPHDTANPVTFQQSVSNLAVLSNVAGVESGSFDRGQIEMWHHSYSAPDATAVFASSATTYDWGDTISATASGFGSFQIHNPGAKQTVLAYNRWATATATNDDVGIGNSAAANPDWTFAANTANHTSRKLVVLVRPRRFSTTFTALPLNGQVTPRTVATNLAAVPIAGRETMGGFEKAVLRVLRNGTPVGADTEQSLTYVSGAAAFAFNPSIPAELASYGFEIYLKQGARLYLARRVSNVTAGDVLLWYGQSNAEAAVRSGSANAYVSPWVRTFGMSSDDATVTQAYPFWVQANGDGSRNVPAGVGQWALVVGRKIVDTYHIPVAILNGSRGGYSMPQLQRDDANLGNLADTGTTVYRVYNRLRYRANLAKVAGGARGIFFYQGESDKDNTAQHLSGFAGLMTDWRTDYPAVEKIFVTQLHVGCSTTRESPGLRDAQRLLPDLYDLVRVNASNGLTAHTDNCHFPFAGGYETHGLNVFKQVARELYGAADSPDMDPPNPARVEIANEAGSRLRIVLRKPGAAITIDSAALVDFRLNGSAAVLLSATATSTAIELQYDRSVTNATSLDYLAHIGSAGGWVRNANGIGLLTFSEPILGNHPRVSIVAPSWPVELTPGARIALHATATTPVGNIARFEVRIDGILHTAVHAAASVIADWKVPAAGKHQILFRATNSAGSVRESSVMVFAGGHASPGGVTAGLQVWLKPESGMVRDADGVVSSWQDRSGMGNDCSQATAAAKPTFAMNAFGPLPGVVFDGDDWLGGPAGMSTGSYTKVARVSLSDFSYSSGNILSSGASTGTRHALYMSGTALPRLWHSAQFVLSSTAMVAGRGHLVVGTYDAATKTGTLYLDGAQVGTGTTTANSSDPSYQLGGLAGANFMRGTIGEIMIYDRVLGSSERASVERYLTEKAIEPAAAVPVSYAAWSAANLPASAPANATGDANGNGIANLVEYALGIDPAATGRPVTLDVRNVGGAVEVRYSRPTDRAGVGYQLLESTDMVNWTPVADLGGDAAGGVEERRYSRPAGERLFYQLRVTMVP